MPPFSAVRAFEAAARHRSFKSAAEELCLSPSAVSHQIRALEDYLATSLFHRDGNRVRLSKTGKAYAGRLTELLDHLADSTERVRCSTEQTVRVLATPGFAARWLVPRLPRFTSPETVRLRIADAAPSIDFASNDADVVIQWRAETEPGVSVWPLLHSARYPVAASGYVERNGIRHPRDLLRATLFRDETDDMWADWFRAAGVNEQPPEDGPAYPNCEYATTAAEAGIGVSLAYDAVVRDTVAEGRLLRLFDTVTPPFTIYAAACEAGRQEEPFIREFRKWLVREADRDGVRPEATIVN